MSSLIDEYVKYASNSCDAPRIFHLACSYWIASTLVGRFARIVTSYAPRGLMPNIWALLIGPSRIVRKTTAMNLAEDIVESVEPKLLMPASFTPEALYELFNQLNEGDSVAWVKDELGGFFKMLEKRYMYGVREILSSLYMGRGEVRKLRNLTLKIPKGLYVTVLGNLPTPPRMYIVEEDFLSGFMNRFILAYALQRDRTIPMMHRDENLTSMRNEIITQYSNLVRSFTGIVPVSVSKTALNMLSDYDSVVEQEILRIERDNPTSLWKSYYAETPFMLLKMATLRRLTRQPPPGVIVVIEENDVEDASKDLKLFLESARKVVEDIEVGAVSAPVVTEEKNLMRVYELIKSSGRNGISKSELLLKTMLSVDTLNKIILTLAEQEKIVAVQIQPMRGRKQLRLYASEYKGDAGVAGEVLSEDVLKALLKK